MVMLRRAVVVAICGLSLSLLAVWASPQSALGQDDCPTAVPSDVQRFSGSTATVTEPFTVQSGILRVSGTHEGRSNFAVIAYSETDYEDLLFNEIGPYTGQTELQVDPGSTLVLEVEADAPWEVVLEPAFGSA
jgi:hypothetical protein